MSLHFITLLREQLDIPLFDSDLIGLYGDAANLLI